MFGNVMYLYTFYCLCYQMGVSAYMLEDQVSEETDLDLNKEEDTRMDEIRDENWRGVSEEGDNKKKMNALRWYIYFKDKEELINIYFPVSVPHPKGGGALFVLV